MKKKLIEVALPLEAINAACKADKNRKTGTVRNLHKWFAPMPPPAWRALLFAAAVDDPGSDSVRRKLFDVVEALCPSEGEPTAEALRLARKALGSIPSGTPTAVPMATEMPECQATAVASWRWVKPRVFNRARSRRRLRTEATRVSPSATTAPAVRAAPRTAGVVPIER